MVSHIARTGGRTTPNRARQAARTYRRILFRLKQHITPTNYG